MSSATPITTLPAVAANMLAGKKKYRILRDEKHTRTYPDGYRVYRIQALRPIYRALHFPVVQPGALGGYISSEQCLSQDGDCWVEGDAVVLGKVTDNAQVRDGAFVDETAIVSGCSAVSGMARVGDPLTHDSQGGGVLIESAAVTDSARVTGDGNKDTIISGFSTITGTCHVAAGAQVGEMSDLEGNVTIAGDIQVGGGSTLIGDLTITPSEESATINGEGLAYINKRNPGVPLILTVPEGGTSLLEYADMVAGDKFTKRGIAEHHMHKLHGLSKDEYEKSNVWEHVEVEYPAMTNEPWYFIWVDREEPILRINHH